ncbi:MAG: hypothetical protein ACPW60_13750 [Methylohalobius sp. ZOD2]
MPHITLKSIANNAEIDVIWERWQGEIAPLLAQLSAVVGEQWIVNSRKNLSTNHSSLSTTLAEWEIPREFPENWPAEAKPLHEQFWQARVERQREIDASIAAKADFEYLYDKPYEDKKKVRVAGPFTVESLSPHRVLGVDENDELIDPNAVADNQEDYNGERDFVQMILENLKTAGVQQAHKDDKITFTSLTPWPGYLICAVGTVASDQWLVDSSQNNVAPYEIFKLVSGFDGLEEINGLDGERLRDYARISRRREIWDYIADAACGGFDPCEHCGRAGEKDDWRVSSVAWRCAGIAGRAGNLPDLIAKAGLSERREFRKLVERLHRDQQNAARADEITIHSPLTTIHYAQVRVHGVDVFHPNTGEVRSDGAEGIACWFIDTDYNEESFFVRHAYFLGANDPYKAIKTTLKSEINQDAWATLNSDTSRPFAKPKSGRIAVKVINHLGDEVMKVFKVN